MGWIKKLIWKKTHILGEIYENQVENSSGPSKAAVLPLFLLLLGWRPPSQIMGIYEEVHIFAR